MNFGAIRYPRSAADCESCHRPGTWSLPASPGRVPSTFQELTCSELPWMDADSYCQTPYWMVTQTTRLAPETAVCTSCHDQPHTLMHAQLNTTVGGAEACATCHGPGRTFDVAAVHAGQ